MRNFNLQWVFEGVLARSCRPCYHDDAPSGLILNKWLNEAAIMKIKAILCLLSKDELTEYYGAHEIDLLAWYRNRCSIHLSYGGNKDGSLCENG
jgi:hypothetical protein